MKESGAERGGGVRLQGKGDALFFISDSKYLLVAEGVSKPRGENHKRAIVPSCSTLAINNAKTSSTHGSKFSPQCLLTFLFLQNACHEISGATLKGNYGYLLSCQEGHEIDTTLSVH